MVLVQPSGGDLGGEGRALGAPALRVFQVMAGAPRGGAETYFEDMVVALQRAGLEQRVAIRKDERRTAMLRDAGLHVIQLRFGGRLDMVTGAALKRATREWPPDIVQTWMSRATRFSPPGPFRRVGWLGGYYNPKYYRRCDHAVGVTPGIVRHLRELGGWSSMRSHYLPTFAQTVSADPVPRESMGTPADARLVVALGRLHWKKGFDVLLRAVAQIPLVWLWLGGDGPLRANLEDLARRLGITERVKFLGWRDDRYDLLAAADLVAMPSRYEPFGTVMLEAWAAAKPLVVAAAAGPRELVRDGVDAILVPVDSPAELAAAIQRLSEDADLARRIATAGHAAWRARFTEETTVAQAIDLYRRIV